MGQIYWHTPRTWSSFYYRHQWSKERLVLCPCRQVFPSFLTKCTFSCISITIIWEGEAYDSLAKKKNFFWNSALQNELFVFTLGVNFYRKGVDGKYLQTTWKVQFNLDSLTSGIYKLRLAIASATRSDLKVKTGEIVRKSYPSVCSISLSFCL